MAGFAVAGAGRKPSCSGAAQAGCYLGVSEEYGDARLERCRAFLLVADPLQTVQRAEFWDTIIAVQADWPGHLEVNNLNVESSIARLLERGKLSKPLPLVEDGDLIAIVQHMISASGLETARIAKVTCHATDADVEQGRVRAEDKLGNMEADSAASAGGSCGYPARRH